MCQFFFTIIDDCVVILVVSFYRFLCEKSLNLWNPDCLDRFFRCWVIVYLIFFPFSQNRTRKNLQTSIDHQKSEQQLKRKSAFYFYFFHFVFFHFFCVCVRTTKLNIFRFLIFVVVFFSFSLCFDRFKMSNTRL